MFSDEQGAPCSDGPGVPGPDAALEAEFAPTAGFRRPVLAPAPPPAGAGPGDPAAAAQLADLDAWAGDCEAPKTRYLDWGSPLLNEALFGATGGDSIFIAGQANFGKSQLQTHLVLNVLAHNPDAVVVDFSLDDHKKKRLTQYAAALGELDMNAVAFADQIQAPAERARYEGARDTLRSWVRAGRLSVFESAPRRDGAGPRVLQARTTFLADTLDAARDRWPDRKLVVAVDALNNVLLPRDAGDENERMQRVYELIEDLIGGAGAVLLATTHLRKNSGRRPVMDDVKGNNFLIYGAKALFGVHNEVKLAQDRARVFWTDPARPAWKMPVVEAFMLKSKVSAFNGVIPFLQVPAQGRMAEATPEVAEVLRTQIYEAL